jgi:hypothetical protein
MEEFQPNGSVKEYEVHIPTLTLPDPDDRHVLAAAICSKVSYIEAIHPDVFLSALFDDKPEVFLHGVLTHRAALKNPPKTVDQYLNTLLVNDLVEIAARIHAHRDLI